MSDHKMTKQELEAAACCLNGYESDHLLFRGRWEVDGYRSILVREYGKTMLGRWRGIIGLRDGAFPSDDDQPAWTAYVVLVLIPAEGDRLCLQRAIQSNEPSPVGAIVEAGQFALEMAERELPVSLIPRVRVA